MIDTVKIQGNGYLVDGCMSVPKANGNRDYQEVLEWIASGNVVEPEFTEAELARQVIDKQVAEALAYLIKTNHKFYIGYIPKDGEDLVATQALRDEALLFIRTNNGN